MISLIDIAIEQDDDELTIDFIFDNGILISVPISIGSSPDKIAGELEAAALTLLALQEQDELGIVKIEDKSEW